LGGGGQIITTPFSYVATTSTIVWEGCTPVFVDIDPVYWTIDETKIEEAITDKTTCILATHVFGNPCNVEEIDRIAKKHNLYVIYDAAHCFGVKYKGKSIFDWGDISTCSFHATKIFHTGEGGAIFVNNKDLYDEVYYSHNFGHTSSYSFYKLGINGKLSELQAAMGLAVLPYMEDIIMKRKDLVNHYLEVLSNSYLALKLRPETFWNYSYMPVLFQNTEERDIVECKMINNNLMVRRYFYPALDDVYYEFNQLEVAEQSRNLNNNMDIVQRILCFPLYHELKKEQINNIINAIN